MVGYNENVVRAVDVRVGHVENREEWRFKTRVADPKHLKERRRKRRIINI
jgi:CRISPR/Cas system-associated protein Cas5 (RAMP superfamily)